MADDEGSAGAIVKLFYETRQDADRAAASADAEGLAADVSRAAVGNAWVVNVTGPSRAVEEFGERVLAEMPIEE